jgi:hypothetical protein
MHVGTPKTVDRALDDLERIGAIEVEHHVDKNGQKENSYLVRQTPKGSGDQVSIPLDTDVQGGRDTDVEGPLDTDVQPKDKSSRDISSKDLKSTSPAEQADMRAMLSDVFSEFWNIYPSRNGKKLGKAKAERQFWHLGTTGRERAMTAVVHYRDACDRGLTLARDPFRWLRDKDFEDWQEPSPARGSPNGVKPDRHRGIDDDWERTPANDG